MLTISLEGGLEGGKVGLGLLVGGEDFVGLLHIREDGDVVQVIEVGLCGGLGDGRGLAGLTKSMQDFIRGGG